jgi:hypothetical protein
VAKAEAEAKADDTFFFCLKRPFQNVLHSAQMSHKVKLNGIEIVAPLILERMKWVHIFFFIKNGPYLQQTPWRNGSASASRAEGCVFESRRGQWDDYT